MKNIYNLAKSGFDVKFDLGNTFYNYVETIGTGAYGIVCHAKSIHDSNDYAIKKIKNPCMNKVTLIRTLREIKILSHFNHPNIINIVDIFLQNTSNIQDIYVVFILMESDLHKIISSNQNLSDDHIRYFMYQILCGVNYIHSASVIHRDLKPANILINSNCLVKITDFGMARLCANSIKQNSKLTKSNLNFNMTQYVMTRWYRAPELLMGQMHYSSKIDLWSCGCIISELYLKKAIFRGDNMILQLKDIIHKIGVPNQLFRSKVLPIVNSLIDSEGEITSPSISQLIPSAPKKVTDLLSHLLVYDPDERWSAKQSLRHIFFVKYRSPTKESTCESNLNLSFEEEETTVESLRMTLMKEISLISLNSNTFQSDHSSPVTTLNELTHSATNSLYKLKEDLSAQSRLSDRTLSADYGSLFNFPLDCYSGLSKSSDKDKNADAHLKTSTISQSTRAKLINSLKQPKDKIQKRVTAVQRQRERKERRSRLKKKRSECINERLVSKKESPQQLSELDTFSLKRWEYLSNSKVTQVNINNREYTQDSDIKTPSKLEITPKSGDIDEMSAGLLSSLSIFDDLDGVVTSNIDEDSVDCNESTNLDEFINMLDIDSIDLDMNLLESYSSDLFNDSRSNSGN